MTNQNHESAQSASKKDWSALYVPSAIIVAGLIIAGAVMFTQRGASAQVGGEKPAIAVDVKKVDIAGHPFIGKPDAPLTIALWADYQCPFCKQGELAILPTIIDEYVTTGKVKIVFKNFAFLGNDSITGAMYDRAVWDLYPEQYFKWRTAMYNAQDEEGDVGFGNEKSIIALTDKMTGINAEKVKAAVEKNKDAYQKDLQDDMKEASSMGINGTPAFIIGKQLISGAENIAKFKSAIDSQLK